MRSAVFLASWFIGILRIRLGGLRSAAHYIASAKKSQEPHPPHRVSDWKGEGVLLPAGGFQAFLQRGKGLRGRRHQPAEAFFEELLDIVRVDMRMAARDPRLLADRQGLVDRAGGLRVVVLARIAHVL